MISRRGLFGAAAGVAAVPFVKADVRAESRPWTEEEMEAEGRKYDEELPRPQIAYLKARVEHPWLSKCAILILDDGTRLSICQRYTPTPITMQSDTQVLVARAEGETHVLNVYVDGKKLDIYHVNLVSDKLIRSTERIYV